jgi:DnaJ-domain-containing protein 1
MFSDGQIAPAERESLYRLGAHRNLARRQVDLIIDSATVDEVAIPVPADSRQALQHLEQLVHAVLADGQLTTREKKLLTSYARRVELSPADLTLAITRERRRAYRSARAELRRVPNAGRL